MMSVALMCAQETGMGDLILEMRNISKTFDGGKALNEVNFSCYHGEIHGLVGENGAGKSTLVKILSGVHQPDKGGEIVLWGKKCIVNNPRVAEKLGIGMVFQEPRLIPDLDIAENVFIGNEPLTKKIRHIDSKAMYEKTAEILNSLNFKALDMYTKVNRLSAPEKQAVEIARVLALNAKIVVLDEPTSSLGLSDTENLFKVLRYLKSQGITIIYISHRLDELFQITDRVTVLRDGNITGTLKSSEMKKDQLINMMIGRSLNMVFPEKSRSRGELILDVKGLCREGVLHDISFKAYRGEVLGVAGLVGSGRSELMRSICGLDPVDKGEITFNGTKKNLKLSPKKTMKLGLVYVSEDRKGEGIMSSLSVKENVILPILDRISKFLFINDRKGRKETEEVVKNLDVKLRNIYQEVSSLSGGNQQKVILGRWLMLGPQLIILDEPTQGIDVGVKRDIYLLIRKLCDRGMAVIMISSDLPEIIGMSDRVIVLSEGKIVSELSAEEATEEKICSYYVCY